MSERVTEGQRTILEILRDHGEPVKTNIVTDEYYGADSSNSRIVTKMLERLRRKGLVYWRQLERVCSDDRSSGWVLTASGRELLERRK